MDALQYVTNNGLRFFACSAGDSQDSTDYPGKLRASKWGIFVEHKKEDLISKWVRMYKETK
jgi:hypothetical protein